ncbi:MAG: hypothetical protein WC565_06750 [Parcubacteria group bacterium]
MPRPGFIQFRADATERAKWQAEADAEGITLSDLIRRRMNEPDRYADMRARLERLEAAMARLLETAVNQLYGTQEAK